MVTHVVGGRCCRPHHTQRRTRLRGSLETAPPIAIGELTAVLFTVPMQRMSLSKLHIQLTTRLEVSHQRRFRSCFYFSMRLVTFPATQFQHIPLSSRVLYSV